MMKVVTQTHKMAKAFGLKEAIRLLAEIGYDGLDLTMFDEPLTEMLDSPDYRERATELRKCADACCIPFRQAHAPFPTRIFGNDEYNEITAQRIERSIAMCGILGVKNIIIHPMTAPENQKQLNIDYYNSLVPLCREAGVKVALENMFTWDRTLGGALSGACSPAVQFCEYLDALDPNYFTACLDIGHVGITSHAYAGGERETAQDAIRTLGGARLKALHVHDNDNQRDLHTLPFLHALDWTEIMRALEDIGYDGDFTLESDNFLNRFPDELLVDAARFMLKVSRHLVGLEFGA